MKSTYRSAVNDTKHKTFGLLPGFHHLWQFAHHRWTKSMNCFVLSILCIVQLTKTVLKSRRWKAPNALRKTQQSCSTVVCGSYTTSWRINGNIPAHRSWLTPQSPKFFCGLKPENTKCRNIKQGTIPLPRAIRSKQYHEAVPRVVSVEDSRIFPNLFFRGGGGLSANTWLRLPGVGKGQDGL